MSKNRKLQLISSLRIVKSSMYLLRMYPVNARFSRIYVRKLRWELTSGNLTKRQMTRERHYNYRPIVPSPSSTLTLRESWRSGNAITPNVSLAMMRIQEFLRRLTTSQIISGYTPESGPLCAISPGARWPSSSGPTITSTWRCMQVRPDLNALIQGAPKHSIPDSI